MARRSVCEAQEVTTLEQDKSGGRRGRLGVVVVVMLVHGGYVDAHAYAETAARHAFDMAAYGRVSIDSSCKATQEYVGMNGL